MAAADSPASRTHRVQAGSYAVERAGLITTVLGSCIAACAHCPVTRFGGLNHFMLPESGARRTNCPLWQSEEGRYGAYAMEILINDLIKRGALRNRLVFKVVGGARMMNGVADVGARNIAFVREFLQREGFAVQAEIVGGEHGRMVRFEPATGRLWVKTLRGTDDQRIGAEERRQRVRAPMNPAAGTVDLF